MSDYFLAPSLVQLRNEIDRRWPDRSKATDGWVGDTRHQQEGSASDHNPDWSAGGIVRAIDVTTADVDANELLHAAINHPACWYVIHKFPGDIPRIWSRTHGWVGNPYGGLPHDHHMHFSILHTDEAANSKHLWLPEEEDVTPQDKQDIIDGVVAKLAPQIQALPSKTWNFPIPVDAATRMAYGYAHSSYAALSLLRGADAQGRGAQKAANSAFTKLSSLFGSLTKPKA